MDTRTLALNAYYYSTYPLRLQQRVQASSTGTAPLCVLFYHRVADTRPNDWTISNDEFQRQMRWLKENCDVVSLEEIQNRMVSGRNDRVAVAITFDDGYAENCERAIPFLVDHQIPVTYFAALDFITSQRPFPHDVQAGAPLAPNTIAQLAEMADAGIEIGAHTRSHCDIGQVSSAETLVDEIVTASKELSALISQPIRYFAFPFGQPENMSAAAVHLAKRHGFNGVCSAYGAYNFPGTDPFHIQRIHGDPEFIRLKNWLTLDARKRSIGRSFEFQETSLTRQQIDAFLAHQA